MGDSLQWWLSTVCCWGDGHLDTDSTIPAVTPRFNGTTPHRIAKISTVMSLLLITALLVIGGVEMNPGPNQPGKEQTAPKKAETCDDVENLPRVLETMPTLQPSSFKLKKREKSIRNVRQQLLDALKSIETDRVKRALRSAEAMAAYRLKRLNLLKQWNEVLQRQNKLLTRLLLNYMNGIHVLYGYPASPA